jgi:putative membrane protein
MTLAFDVILFCIAVAYLRCWLRLRDARRVASRIRLLAFMSGVVFLWAALASPIAHLDTGHLTGHMLQHLLIMTVAAPLFLLGEPIYVFALGQPSRPTKRWLTSMPPALCWLLGTFTVLFWHVPRMFEVGMQHHVLQHATFLAAGLVFWVPVLEPWPGVSRWPRWSMPLYLLFATFPCDALSAFLAFCGRPVYPHYSARGELCGGVSVLEDQARAGTLMWFWVTVAYMVPAVLITVRLLAPSDPRSPSAINA